MDIVHDEKYREEIKKKYGQNIRWSQSGIFVLGITEGRE